MALKGRGIRRQYLHNSYPEATNATEKLPSYFVNSRSIITHAKAYDLSTMSILSVVRYFLLLNQLSAEDIFTSYSYGCWIGVSIPGRASSRNLF